MKPYLEIPLTKNTFIREFDQKDSDEFVWHRDKEDRIIESLDQTDWMFQLDNQLPKPIVGKIFIPKETFHRLIKGTGILKIKLEKL